jgi:hypothetical protein
VDRPHRRPIGARLIAHPDCTRARFAPVSFRGQGRTGATRRGCP